MWIVLSIPMRLQFSTRFPLISDIHYWEIEQKQLLAGHEDKIILRKIVFDDNNQEWKSRSSLGQTCSRPLLLFLSQFFVILFIIIGCFRTIHLSKTFDELTLWVVILCSAPGYILFFTKPLNKPTFTKNGFFISLIGPSKTGKSQLNYNWLKMERFNQILTKPFFYQHSQPVNDGMQKEIDNLISRLWKVWTLNL